MVVVINLFCFEDTGQIRLNTVHSIPAGTYSEVFNRLSHKTQADGFIYFYCLGAFTLLTILPKLQTPKFWILRWPHMFSEVFTRPTSGTAFSPQWKSNEMHNPTEREPRVPMAQVVNLSTEKGLKLDWLEVAEWCHTVTHSRKWPDSIWIGRMSSTVTGPGTNIK